MDSCFCYYPVSKARIILIPLDPQTVGQHWESPQKAFGWYEVISTDSGICLPYYFMGFPQIIQYNPGEKIDIVP